MKPSNANGYAWPEWFKLFGFNEALRKTGEDGSLAIEGDMKDLYERGFELVGSPETVSRKIEVFQKEIDLQYLLMWTYNGLIPHDTLMRSICLRTKSWRDSQTERVGCNLSHDGAENRASNGGSPIDLTFYEQSVI